MNSKPASYPANPSKRIGIAIELDHLVPWHYDCCEGILSYGRSRGWSCTIDPKVMEDDSTGQVGWAYDGIVGRIDAEVAQVARARGIPMVNHWNNSPAKGLSSVAIDYRASAQMIGEHLVTCGYRHLGYLDRYGLEDSPAVIQGLGQAAADAGLAPPTMRLVEPETEFKDDMVCYRDFLGDSVRWLAGFDSPVGLYIGDIAMARYVAQRCLRAGLKIPEEVGIVLWSDDVSTHTISPTLSGMEHDWFKVGYEAAALLDELMQGQEVHPKHRLVTSTRLVQRESTDVFLCEDELVKEAMQYIAEHCRQTLTIEDVAEALHVSERTLRRKFDTVLGRTVPDEIKRLRIERLKVMVQETNQPIGEIAEAFGFSSGGQFSRYFSTAAGMPPTAYRKKYGKKDEG